MLLPPDIEYNLTWTSDDKFVPPFQVTTMWSEVIDGLDSFPPDADTSEIPKVARLVLEIIAPGPQTPVSKVRMYKNTYTYSHRSTYNNLSVGYDDTPIEGVLVYSYFQFGLNDFSFKVDVPEDYRFDGCFARNGLIAFSWKQKVDPSMFTYEYNVHRGN